MTEERIKELLALCEKAGKILQYLCENHTPLKMCIPVQSDDHDVVFGGVITALPEALAELTAAREEIARLQAKVTLLGDRAADFEGQLAHATEIGRKYEEVARGLRSMVADLRERVSG
jgi:DNA repair ATPase RecN